MVEPTDSGIRIRDIQMEAYTDPADWTVEIGTADLLHRGIGKFSDNRGGLFDDAEENLLHKASSFASNPSFYRLVPTRSANTIELIGTKDLLTQCSDSQIPEPE